MSRRNKLEKFADLLSFPNVLENFRADNPKLLGLNGAPVDPRGRWAAEQFGNQQPLILELACGRGEYTVGLARLYPGRNFIGIDIKGARIWKGARSALDEGLPNAAFLRTRIERIAWFFAPREVSEIWITFPDPFLRQTQANRRLTSPAFLDEYRKILASGGLVHLKTDSEELFEYTLKVLDNYPAARLEYQENDLYARPRPLPELDIPTYYERVHQALGKTIKYVRFVLEPAAEEEEKPTRSESTPDEFFPDKTGE